MQRSLEGSGQASAKWPEALDLVAVQRRCNERSKKSMASGGIIGAGLSGIGVTSWLLERFEPQSNKSLEPTLDCASPYAAAPVGRRQARLNSTLG